MEMRSGFNCDCCKVFVPSMEACSFDILNDNKEVIQTIKGHKACIEFDSSKYERLESNNA